MILLLVPPPILIPAFEPIFSIYYFLLISILFNWIISHDCNSRCSSKKTNSSRNMFIGIALILTRLTVVILLMLAVVLVVALVVLEEQLFIIREVLTQNDKMTLFCQQTSVTRVTCVNTVQRISIGVYLIFIVRALCIHVIRKAFFYRYIYLLQFTRIGLWWYIMYSGRVYMLLLCVISFNVIICFSNTLQRPVISESVSWTLWHTHTHTHTQAQIHKHKHTQTDTHTETHTLMVKCIIMWRFI